MATYIKGDAVANATSYDLLEKSGDGAYNVIANNTEINFDLEALGLTEGEHVFVVKAKADGYDDSDYSNEVTWVYDDGVTNWEFYSQSADAQMTVGEDGDLYVTDTVAAQSRMCVALASVNGGYSLKSPYFPSTAASNMLAIYAVGTEGYYFRCNGSTGVALQRYSHATFSGSKQKEDASATAVYTGTDKIGVEWEGNTAVLYINDARITSFDMSAYMKPEGRKVAGVAYTFFSAGANNRKIISDFATS